MIGRTSAYVAYFVVVLLSVACENSFTPKGPYIEKMIVYAILDSQSDTQYVRLYTTYNPLGFDPTANTVDHVVRDADVIISQSASETYFRDTVVVRLDKTRYRDDIGAFVAYPFAIQKGRSYDLIIVSGNHGRVTATASVPDKGRLQVVNRTVLKGGGDKDEELAVLVWIRYATQGYVVRCYLDAEILEGGVRSLKRIEMPSQVIVKDNTTRTYNYPGLQRRTTAPESVSKEKQELVYFSRLAYDLMTYDVNARYSSQGIRINGAWFVLTQVEQNMYTYYKIANAFQDGHSIRTDLPNWTNINGGYGVFGAMTQDSLYVDFSIF